MNNYSNNAYYTTTTDYTGWIVLIAILVLGILFLVFWAIRKTKIRAKRFSKAREFILLKVLVPKDRPKEGEQPKNFKELIAVAEQFLSVFQTFHIRGWRKLIFDEQPVFSLEIIAREGQIYFFVGMPNQFRQAIEKQVQGFYPTIQLNRDDDFKIFNDEWPIECGQVKLIKKFILPIKTYPSVESDPLAGLTNTFSKIGAETRASIQILLKPNNGRWSWACNRAAKKVMEGKSIPTGGWAAKAVNSTIEGAMNVNKKPGEDSGANSFRQTPQQEELQKALQMKGSKVGYNCEIKAVVTSPDRETARINLGNILASFSQFGTPVLNNFKTKIILEKNAFLKAFIWRYFMKKGMILNVEEIVSIYHFPNYLIDTPNIHWLLSKLLPPPPNLPAEGVVIGESFYRGEKKMVRMKGEDRRRHIFMIGKTGTGKTTFFENMIDQDIRDGKGVCFIDPNGDAIESIMSKIPKERAEDVILFDPSDTERPVGLNLLEWERPEDKDFLIAEWLEIFYKLFDPNRTGMVGPQFEHWGRNAALTVMSQPDGGTLIDVPRMFTDDAFRDKLVGYIEDPIVKSFWEEQIAKTADFHKSEMLNYFISKFGRFMTNDLMRNIIGQKKSAFNLREVMDSGKILLINLSKGKIGEANSTLLGLILVSKIQVAAFARADTPEEKRRDFYLYVDEFQNFTTDSFATILSEARKYHLNLNITNQYIAQLTEKIRDAVIGNAGSLVVYRIGAADAEFMTKEFPGVSVEDMANLDKFNMYTKLLIDLTPSKPFSMKGIKSPAESTEQVREQIRQLSRLKYGRDKKEIDAELIEHIKSFKSATPNDEPLKKV